MYIKQAKPAREYVANRDGEIQTCQMFHSYTILSIADREKLVFLLRKTAAHGENQE